jgi:hypothetical protein
MIVLVAIAGLIMWFSASHERMMNLTVSDTKGLQYTLRFGTDPNATDGFDSLLGEMPIPPISPPGTFDIRFLDRPGHPRIPGDGSYIDVRPLRSHAQVDTFIVRFQSSSDAYPLTLKWDRVTATLCDSMIILYRIEEAVVPVNMSKQRTMTIHDESISSLRIIKYGAH